MKYKLGSNEHFSLVKNGSTTNLDEINMSTKEDNSNKVTSLSSSSTDVQYPSAKCVYDEVKKIYYSDIQISDITEGELTGTVKTKLQALRIGATTSKFVILATDTQGNRTGVTATIDSYGSMFQMWFVYQGRYCEVTATPDDTTWTAHWETLEKTSNKVTSLSSSSTDTQYPSAKAVYTELNNISEFVFLSGPQFPLYTSASTTYTWDLLNEDTYLYYDIEAGGKLFGFIQCSLNGTNYNIDIKAINSSTQINLEYVNLPEAFIYCLSNPYISRPSTTGGHGSFNLPTGTMSSGESLIIKKVCLYRIPKTFENTSNKVTSLSSSSTDVQYPSAKAVYDSVSIKNTTYSALKTLRNNSQLVPGGWYRITDYVTTTVSDNTQSAGHQFDVIVRADEVNKLNENAYAAKHAGDTYFTNSKLEVWELKYSLDNDTNRFAWADNNSGKGVIYRMIDEFNNDVPYDFKNVQYVQKLGFTAYRYGPSATTTYVRYEANDTTVGSTLYYGFKRSSYVSGPPPMEEYVWTTTTSLTTSMSLYSISGGNVSSVTGTITKVSSSSFNTYTFDVNGSDASLSGGSKYVIGNSIASYVTDNKQFLNVIYFRSTGSNLSAYYNSFNVNCHDMSFSYSCYNNSFGYNCSDNSFRDSCYGNSFGYGCSNNLFADGCYNNSFGNGCSDNSFISGSNNSFGNNCSNNSFTGSCNNNSFGNNCSNNSFGIIGAICNNNSFGNDCSYNSF